MDNVGRLPYRIVARLPSKSLDWHPGGFSVIFFPNPDLYVSGVSACGVSTGPLLYLYSAVILVLADKRHMAYAGGLVASWPDAA